MGSRDYRHREPKKPRKEAKKVLPATILPSPMTVEVIKRKRKEREEETESEPEK